MHWPSYDNMIDAKFDSWVADPLQNIFLDVVNIQSILSHIGNNKFASEVKSNPIE
jgi:hypothetical protein